MLGLPKSTELDRRVPKQKFYENLTVPPLLKRAFVEQIKGIWWRNKIAPSTMNVAAGEAVTEVEVFELSLTAPRLDEAVLRQIDKEVPYHILFLLEYEGKYQAWTAYKEAAGGGTNAFKVGSYYHTDWMEEAALPLRLEGLDTDQLYENFVRQIAGETFSRPDETLKESVDRETRRKALEKQIAVLVVKLRREEQFNRQVELNGRLKQLKEELERLT